MSVFLVVRASCNKGKRNGEIQGSMWLLKSDIFLGEFVSSILCKFWKIFSIYILCFLLLPFTSSNYNVTVLVLPTISR